MTLLAKSAIIYLAPPPPADLAEKIVARRHIPIGQAEAQRVGFIPPTQGGSHVRTVGDNSRKSGTGRGCCHDPAHLPAQCRG